MPAIPQHVSDYIRTFDGTLSGEACADFIERFEASPQHQVQQQSPGLSFTELNVSEHWPDQKPGLEALFHDLAQAYALHTGLFPWWVTTSYEAMRMKRYLPGGADCFKPHLDRVNALTAHRSLVMFLYLNDVAEGGETAFPQWDIHVQPHAGRLIAFPAGFPWVHEGKAPVQGAKYILSCYKND